MIARDNDPDVFNHFGPTFQDAAFIRHLGIKLDAAQRARAVRRLLSVPI